MVALLSLLLMLVACGGARCDAACGMRMSSKLAAGVSEGCHGGASAAALMPAMSDAMQGAMAMHAGTAMRGHAPRTMGCAMPQIVALHEIDRVTPPTMWMAARVWEPMVWAQAGEGEAARGARPPTLLTTPLVTELRI